jgi:hypothetical protein
MHKNTFIMFDSGQGHEGSTADGLIKPGYNARIVTRTQVPIRPHRLRIEPEIAPFFMIENVQAGLRCLFPTIQRVPATQFSIGLGDGLDAGDVYPGMDLIIDVTNTSHLVPGGPLGPCSAHRDAACRLPICLKDPRRLGVPLPFRATWAAIVIPPRVCRIRPGEVSAMADKWQCIVSEGDEAIDTRIDRVQGTVGSPPVIRRELPGFGWDPYGNLD